MQFDFKQVQGVAIGTACELTCNFVFMGDAEPDEDVLALVREFLDGETSLGFYRRRPLLLELDLPSDGDNEAVVELCEELWQPAMTAVTSGEQRPFAIKAGAMGGLGVGATFVVSLPK